MSNESETKRIDLTQFEKIGLYVAPEWANLIAELKRCYESEDRLLELLQIMEDQYDIPVKQIAATMSI